MQIDFNNLRRILVNDFNSLVENLNCGIVENTDYQRVVVPVREIERIIDSLRNDIVTIGCLYENNNKDCECILTDDLKVSMFAP